MCASRVMFALRVMFACGKLRAGYPHPLIGYYLKVII